jgi:DHA2 family multidrug resistance protein
MFANRNFVLGQVLIFAVGAILLETLALLTPYLEQLMNYPVLEAGLVLAPRGFGTMASMLLVGTIIDRVGARILIVAGLLLTAQPCTRWRCSRPMFPKQPSSAPASCKGSAWDWYSYR